MTRTAQEAVERGTEPRGRGCISREQVRWARDKELLIYRTLQEERNRVQIDEMQRRQFGQWSDVFASLDRCKGRVMLCILGKTVIGYQAFEPFAVKGSPFPADCLVMRFTFVNVREDEVAKARGLGIGRALLYHTLDLAWSRGYRGVYSYVTAYELLLSVGFNAVGGERMVQEAQWIRDMDPDSAPPLLFVIERPKDFVSRFWE